MTFETVTDVKRVARSMQGKPDGEFLALQAELEKQGLAHKNGKNFQAYCRWMLWMACRIHLGKHVSIHQCEKIVCEDIAKLMRDHRGQRCDCIDCLQKSDTRSGLSGV